MNIIKQKNTCFPFISKNPSYNITISCDDGFQLTLNSVGASIRQLIYPFPDGSLRNIVLSFADDTTYLSNSLYAGATLAPCAGRISHGCLPIENTIYSLSRNENNIHTLHGGSHNASFANWNLRSVHAATGRADITFDILLPDGLDGFPGNRKITACYTLLENHTLTVFYEAFSDKCTYFNISNHTYFNLNGDFSIPVYDHTLRLQAESYTRNGIDFIPECISPVENTPFDFRKPVSLSTYIEKFTSNDQLIHNKGYNHAFVLTHPSDCADLYCTAAHSPVQLTAMSDSPCMVLYTGGFIEPGLSLSHNQKSISSCAMAFEFQDYPDASGKHNFPFLITQANEKWSRTITYKLSSR